MSSSGFADVPLNVDPWRAGVFLISTLVVFLNIFALQRVSQERVKTTAGLKPVVIWIFCCFRAYFQMVVVFATLAAFLTGLAALILGVPLFIALMWITVLVVVSFGTVAVHRSTIEDAVERGVLADK